MRLDEIKQALVRKSETQTKQVAIIFDGKQYNLRIPLEFALRANINTDTDEFEFELTVPAEHDISPSLRGELIEKNKI